MVLEMKGYFTQMDALKKLLLLLEKKIIQKGMHLMTSLAPTYVTCKMKITI